MFQLLREESGSVSRLDTIAFLTLVVTVFLLPLFFIPVSAMPFIFTKTALLALGVLLATIFCVSAHLKSGHLTAPRSVVLFGVWLVALAYFVSALFSGNLARSLTGVDFAVDTFGFMLIAALLATLGAVLLRNARRICYLTVAFGVSLLIVALFQTARMIFGTDFLNLGIFTGSTGNLLGNWNSLAVLFGLSVILGMLSLEGFDLGRRAKISVYALLVISVLFLMAVNFTPVWWIVGIFAFGFFTYSIFQITASHRRGADIGVGENMNADMNDAPRTETTQRNDRRQFIIPLLLLVLAIGFIVRGDVLGQALSNVTGVNYLEARPSWQSTVTVGKEAYRENFLFGTGPNHFQYAWAQHKPRAINETVFWNSDFASGIGIIPTSFITTGLAGALAWLALLGALLFVGFKTLLLRRIEDGQWYMLTLSTFFASVYLLLLMVFYNPGPVVVALTFLAVGAFVGSVHYGSGRGRVVEFSFAENPRAGFVLVFVLSGVLLSSVAGLYLVGQDYAASIAFRNAVVALNRDGNTNRARDHINQAVALNQTDTYERLAAQVGLARLNELFGQTGRPAAELREEFQNTLGTAIRHARTATELGAADYRNWIVLGDVYAAVAPLNIEGSAENASGAYDRARELHPSGPAIALAKARLALAQGNNAGAAARLQEAIELKENYTEAYFLLAQIQVQEGDTQSAISSVESAALLAPQNPVIFFQLGLLYYNENRFGDAVLALERAVALNNDYSNARYFLGLAYAEQDQNDEAIQQFVRIAELNPDNQEVQTVLENLRAGREPFGGTEAGDPAERDELPIEGE